MFNQITVITVFMLELFMNVDVSEDNACSRTMHIHFHLNVIVNLIKL